MEAEGATDGYLFDLYRRYVGEPEDRTDVYVGFGLFLGGIAFAVVAFLLFLLSTTLERPSDVYWTVAQIAYAVGMISLPVAMVGIVVLLPSERRVLVTSVAGVAVATLAVGGFVWSYPSDWNFHGDNYTAHVVAAYAIGLAGIVASTGAALIAHYLDLAKTTDATTASTPEEPEHYSDEEIQRDIDEAMDGVELSWGGVEKSENTQLSFTDHDFDSVDLEGGTKTVRSSGVDDQVSGLKGLKGGEKETATSSSTVDDQTAKLTELREKQRTDEAPKPTGDDGLLARVKRLFAGIKRRLGDDEDATGRP
ncbi:DUF7139 domain-containing protein [Natrialbaceae archaeon AArc-T1-2]|uniref:DUF7139 domain-containing protein n=1 Tax=Natrialbaceae archaeon AArc-T1-2 TaxID=3053904 RepID=UPI00255B280A|nr:permease [Natrialbaceae archaeon AArc-T1-2]WIV67273.1 permease [Natrialbaceae archaeon AArc-T1-2]